MRRTRRRGSGKEGRDECRVESQRRAGAIGLWPRAGHPTPQGTRSRAREPVLRTTRKLRQFREAPWPRGLLGTPSTLEDALACFFPGDAGFGGGFELGKSLFEIGLQLVGNRDRLGCRSDTVPDELDELDTLGNGQLKNLRDCKCSHPDKRITGTFIR